MESNGKHRGIPESVNETHSEPLNGDISAEKQVLVQENTGGLSTEHPVRIGNSLQEASGINNGIATDGTVSEELKLFQRARKYGRDPGRGSLTSGAGGTCSDQSYQFSVDVGVMLATQYCNSLDIGHMEISDICPIGFANFMLKEKPKWAKGTWKVFRRCFKTLLKHHPHPKNELAISLVYQGHDHPLAHLHLDCTEPDGKPTVNAKRSNAAKPAKGFPKKDYDALLNHFETKVRSKYRNILIAWLKAGLATGLRPIEWQSVSIETLDDHESPTGRKILLHVLNAKSTNGRANGTTRTLDISNFQPDTLEAIERMAEFGWDALEHGTFDFKMKACRQIMQAACRKVFNGGGSGTGKSYSLYQLRHQFMANMKSLKSRQDVAELAGHISIETARRNYAKKRDAWPLKDIHDIASVHNTAATVKHEPPQFESRSDFEVSLDGFMV